AAELLEVFPEVAAAEEHLPAALPVQGRRRTLQPHDVPVSQAEGREQGSERVADQRRVKFAQVARAEDDQRGEPSCNQKPPQECLDLFARHERASSPPWAGKPKGQAGEQVRSVLSATNAAWPLGT